MSVSWNMKGITGCYLARNQYALLIILLIISCVTDKHTVHFENIFEPVLVIGDTSNVNKQFKCPVVEGKFGWPQVRVDSTGRIYILDRIFFTIDEYNIKGEHLNHINLVKGKGPGEVIHPVSFAIDDSGGIYVMDNTQMKINKYHKGKYLDSFKYLKRSFNMSYIPGYGLILLNVGPINRSGNIPNTLFQVVNLQNKEINGLGVPMPSADEWGGYSFLIKNDTIWAVSGGGYEVGEYIDFRLVKVFKGDRDCVPPKYIERGGKTAVAWPAPSGIGSVFVNEDYLFVTTYGEVGNNLDILNRETGRVKTSFENFTGLFEAYDNENNVYISYGSYIAVGKIRF